MGTLLIAIGAFFGFLIAYHTYGRWLARKIFQLDPEATVPSVALNDDKDYVPTKKAIVFGHHFTSIAGTGPIVGPAIAVMWGWLPALLWVFFGSILIGAVHDFGALVVSMRNRGQTVGEIAGRVLNPRVRLMFLFVLFMALTIVLARCRRILTLVSLMPSIFETSPREYPMASRSRSGIRASDGSSPIALISAFNAFLRMAASRDDFFFSSGSVSSSSP